MGSHRRPPLTCDASPIGDMTGAANGCGELAVVILALDCPRHPEHAIRRPLCRAHHDRARTFQDTRESTICVSCFERNDGWEEDYRSTLRFVRVPLSPAGRWHTRRRRLQPGTVELTGRLAILVGGLLLVAILVLPHITSAAADVFDPCVVLLAVWGGLLIERDR